MRKIQSDKVRSNRSHIRVSHTVPRAKVIMPVIEPKVVRKPIGDELLEIEFSKEDTYAIQIRPLDKLSIQVKYVPDGPLSEHEIYDWLWAAERNFRRWTPAFSNQVLEWFREVTKNGKTK